MFRKASVFTLALLLFVSLAANAGTTGKIAGRVTDQDGNPLIGATVMIIGTSFGAMTDPNGEYFIINLQPGTYDLQASMVGMGKQTAEGASVIVDMTTRMDFVLSPTTIGNTVITVTDQRGMILRGVTSSVSVVSRDEIRTMPVAGITDVVNQQAGAVERGGLHMRGGRGGEVAYVVDGVSQTDPNGKTSDQTIPLSAVAETSVISGGFGAEYGDAQSGIINVVTREGGGSYTGSLSMNGNDFDALGISDGWAWGYPGQWFGGRHFNGEDGGPIQEFGGNKIADFAEARLSAEASLGGPEPITQYLLPAMGLDVGADVRFFAAVKWLQYGGGRDGNYAYYLNQGSDQWNGNMKLTIKPNPRTKLNFSGFYRNTDTGLYSGNAQYGWYYARFEDDYVDPLSGDTIPGQDIRYGLPDRNFENYSMGFSLTQTLSDASFLEFKVNQYVATEERRILDPDGGYVGEGYTAEDWLNYTPTRTQDSDGFYRSGASRFAWYDSESSTATARLDVTSQVNQQHQLKYGLEGKYYDVYEYSVDTASGGNIYMGEWSAYPHAASAYMQDKMEYRGMIVNAGLRFDYFNPNYDDYPADLTDPVNPGTSVEDPDHINNPVGVSAKYHLSPRIGFSHPITERDVLHFTYGHYFQVPDFGNMFGGANFDLSGAFPIVGNPDLAPEETIAYEVGIKHQFDDITMLDITGYYKDITGLLDMQKNYFTAVDAYDLFINGDYGNVRGAEFTLMRRPSNFISFSANYTYSIAKGKSSSAYQNYNYAWAGWVIPKRESFLEWDQRHEVNANFDFRVPRNEGPAWGGTRYLQGLGLSLQWNYGSGFPYNASGQATADPEINGERYPFTMNTTAKLNKMFWMGDTSVNMYVWVLNLFNRANISTIRDAAWYDADQDGNGYPDHDPRSASGQPDAYSRRRRIRFGIDFEW
ncbi:MAG: TonB-dependent receptor [Candidatus Fermentibacteraceae bacterium]|nr:TonB-dependent receptor [Candidatus Fermentibacteraceae bacterium]